MRERSRTADSVGPRLPGTWRVGRVAGVGLFVNVSWVLMAVLVAAAMLPLISETLPGVGPGKWLLPLLVMVLLTCSVLAHEVTHAFVSRQLAIPVKRVTLHFLGGATEIDDAPRTAGQEAWLAASGPAASLLIALALFALTSVVPERLDTLGLVLDVTFGINLVIGLANLLPALPLDGGRLLRAGVWRVTGNPHHGTLAASWTGRVLAVATILGPFFAQEVLDRPVGTAGYIAAAFIAFHLWAGAESEIRSASLEHDSARLNVRELVRPVVTLNADMVLNEAMGRQADAKAGAILVRDNHGPVVGIVSEAALVATPRERRDWLTLRSVVRTTGISGRIVLSADISGFELLQAMAKNPATEYLLRETNGDILGVVSASDVEDALGAGWALSGWLCLLEPRHRRLFPTERDGLH